MADRVDERTELLTRLELAVLRRLCERLEDPAESATPAFLDVARKIIEAQPAPVSPKAPPVSRDLPFPAPDEDN